MLRSVIHAIILATGLLCLSASAGSINIATDGTTAWTINVPSLGLSNAAPHIVIENYIQPLNTSTLSPFSGGDCTAYACYSSGFDGFWAGNLSFTLPADAINILLSFSSLMADDRAVLELNGIPIGNVGGSAPGVGSMTFTDGGPNNSFTFVGRSPQAGSAAGGFNLGGANTLTLIVNNTQAGMFGTPTGFGYTLGGLVGTVTYTQGTSAVPEPASWILLTTAIPAGLVLRRLKRR